MIEPDRKRFVLNVIDKYSSGLGLKRKVSNGKELNVICRCNSGPSRKGGRGSVQGLKLKDSNGNGSSPTYRKGQGSSSKGRRVRGLSSNSSSGAVTMSSTGSKMAGGKGNQASAAGPADKA